MHGVSLCVDSASPPRKEWDGVEADQDYSMTYGGQDESEMARSWFEANGHARRSSRTMAMSESAYESHDYADHDYADLDVVQGTLPQAVQGSLPQAVQGTLPQAVQGALPRAVQGTLPQAVQGALPRAAQGSRRASSSRAVDDGDY